MYQLAYVSQESKAFSSQQLTELLQAARKKNNKISVTGMLLYRNGSFLQILEGKEDIVTELFDTIVNDSRHTNVVQILDRNVQQREFEGWAMGFDRLHDADLEGISGTFFFEQFTDAEFVRDPEYAHRLLLYFKELSS